jgi:hypothetical protein
MTLQGVHLAETGCAIPGSPMFSMLELVKIGCVLGKLGLQNTPCTPGLANTLMIGLFLFRVILLFVTACGM